MVTTKAYMNENNDQSETSTNELPAAVKDQLLREEQINTERAYWRDPEPAAVRETQPSAPAFQP
jgi:hypothetical protein